MAKPIEDPIARYDRRRSHYLTLLDLKLEFIDEGRAVMRMPFRDEITNGTGAVHGGAIASLCDTCFYMALASIYGEEQETTTASLHIAFLAPAVRPHDLIAEARVLKAGRRIVYGEVSVLSGEKMIAHATLNFLNTPPR